MKFVSVVVFSFILGLASGVALSQTEVEAGGAAPSESGARDLNKTLRPLKEPHPSVLNRITRLEHQVKILTTRLGAMKADTGSADTDVVKMKQGAESAASIDAIRSVFEDQIESEDSTVRQAVGQIVRDEFQNMRSEWSAFRKARGEVRDEEFVEEFSNTADLNAEERSAMVNLLSSEREEISALRRKARETFDIKGGRESSRERRMQTDEAARELLGAERFEDWMELRKKRRPPWRR